MDSQCMRNYISTFRLEDGPRGNQGYCRVLLQIFGLTGHGKSSFINSCKYVVDDGPYMAHAKVAGSAEKPETMIRHQYRLTETITLVDNRGCVKMDKNEIGEIYAQLGNFLPLEKKVNWQTGFHDMMELLLQSERLDLSSDFIVPVLIYSADCLVANVNEMKEILIAARDITGLFPTVVLTHEISHHLSQVKESFRTMGVKNMFSLENYTAKDNVKTRGKHETILRCVQEIIKDVEFRMLDERDAIGDRIGRKRFLLEFAHRRELERKQQKKENDVCAIL
ncbi:uncharacterized protein LOC143785062 [Ranitomeya variabilis]|uniref:uncharacterized protein LOC143785062 n=1 Tax=Ranitomeya variabilis TaxID=490064 RepID=UPI004057C3D6